MYHNKNTIGEKENGKPRHKIQCTRNKLRTCLWFLLRSKSSRLRNSMKAILARKATGNHLIKSTSLEQISEPCLWSLVSATLEIEQAIEFHESNIGEKGNGKPSHKVYFLRTNIRAVSLVSGFCYARNRVCYSMKAMLARKATGNHLIKSTFLDQISEPCLWSLVSGLWSLVSATLKIECAIQ